MRIGFFHARKHYLRQITTTLETLHDRGHELVFCASELKPKIRPPRSLRGQERISNAVYPARGDDGLAPSQRVLRALRDAVRYESPALSDAHATRDRAYDFLDDALARAGSPLTVSRPPAGQGLEWLDEVLREAERMLPPSAPMMQFIREQELDVAVAVTRVNFGTNDAGVIRAAKAVGVPVGLVVWSWDNLTSKGLIHELPDKLFVWNDLQAREAIDLHAVDPAAVEVTGAPRFDSFWAREPSASREELLAGWGLDPARKTVLYLCSSGFIVPDERAFVDEWAATIRRSDDSMLRDANILVRPHPSLLDLPVWSEWEPDDPGISVPRVEDGGQQLWDQIYASDVTVALNTSAELEAAIVGRPVLTILIGEAAPGQHGTTHFDYLLAEEGGFVETADTLDEHLPQLVRTLHDDPLGDTRRAFVERFLRPRGIARPAGDELAFAIERLGGA